jgi:hypothetical protein
VPEPIPQALTTSKAKPYPYPGEIRDLINTKEKKKAVAADNAAALLALATENLSTIVSKTDEEIRSEFKDLPSLKKEIKDLGGSIHARAGWDQTISVYRDLKGISVPDEAPDGIEDSGEEE